MCLKKELQTETKLKHFCLLKFIFFYNKRSSYLEVLWERTLFGITRLNYRDAKLGILRYIHMFETLHTIFVTENILSDEFLKKS